MLMRTVLIAVILTCPLLSQGKLPYSQATKYQASVSRPVMAADGQSFYSLVWVYDPEKNQDVGATVRFDFEGNVLERTKPMGGTFSPDQKRLVVLRYKDGTSSLWNCAAGSDDCIYLTDVYWSDHFLGHHIEKNWVWSPDGRFIAYVGAERAPDRSPQPVKAYSRVLYKTRRGYTDGIRTHVWVVPSQGGPARQLTRGDFDVHALDWHPSGDRISFLSNRTGSPDHNHNNDLWTVDVQSGKIERITDTPGTEDRAIWSPDGKWMAYLARVRSVNTKDNSPENPRLMLRPAEGGPPRRLAAAFDRRILHGRKGGREVIGQLDWSPDSKYLYFIADHHGGKPLYRVSIEQGKAEPVVAGDFVVHGFEVSAKSGRIAYKRSTPSDPGELWVADLDGKNARQITHVQDNFKKYAQLSIPQEFWFESFDGARVQGWAMQPEPHREGVRYPTILRVHGGPHASQGFWIDPKAQELTEAGFAVLYINPRGSTGYGQTFVDGTINNWGGGDFQDLMAGVDHAVARFEWIDPQRLGITGASYGGFMTNWAVTQTDRFKAGVTVSGISNLISFYGTSLYQLLIETEFPGKLWDNYDLLWHWSPLKHVGNARTPLLILHGEDDQEVPIGQAEQMFTALRKVGVEATLVRYTGQTHSLRGRSNVNDARQRTIGWFRKHLGEASLEATGSGSR